MGWLVPLGVVLRDNDNIVAMNDGLKVKAQRGGQRRGG